MSGIGYAASGLAITTRLFAKTPSSRDRSERQEAYDLRAPIHRGFTEDFDTRDLKEAKALSQELAQSRGGPA
jgi:hypothetical protein